MLDSRWARRGLLLALLAAAPSGCSLVVEDTLRGRGPGMDGGTGSACAAVPDGTFCSVPGLADRLICLDGACVVSACGDGFADLRTSPSGMAATEACDDGNEIDGDGCDLDCSFSCDADATCDDGDPCNGAERCDVEGSHACEGGTPLVDTTPCNDTGTCRSARCVPEGCGDGSVSAAEECDDGNETPGDGCETTCVFSCHDDTECQDGDACNGVESCALANHTCVDAAAPLDCDDGDACTSDACDAATGCTHASVLVDGDGDGFPGISAGCGGSDCDDANAAVNPGASEVCGNMVDENCDGTASTPTWYPDCDGDGFAPGGAGGTSACSAPSGAPSACSGASGATWTSRAPSTPSASDCEPAAPQAYPGSTTYRATATPSGRFDWNCDSAETREYSIGMPSRGFVECGFDGRGNCVGTSYYASTLATCGTLVTLSHCSEDAITMRCGRISTSSYPVRCR